MKYLNIEKEDLESKGALFTAIEIAGQPELWSAVYNKIKVEENEIKEFVKKSLGNTKKIVLTGAGTSAYIGFSIEGSFQRKTNITTVSIPTTHLVSHPQDYFDLNTPTLLVSFARSGNSPESVATIELADKYCNTCHHLIITCNEEGSLAKYNFKNESYVFILPPEANDKSLAMTGSYSGMLLAALLINSIDLIDKLSNTVNALKNYGKTVLSKYAGILQDIARKPFKRAVFLGSGPLFGTAMESQLKLQELTDGQIICKNESFLGFRHGPKAVVDETTLLIYYFSNNPDSYRYERDLVNGMDKGKQSLYQVGVSEKNINGVTLDAELILPQTKTSLSEEFQPVCFILIGQLLGFYKSLELGLKPDYPSISGAISRVVEGVIIYD